MRPGVSFEQLESPPFLRNSDVGGRGAQLNGLLAVQSPLVSLSQLSWTG